MSAVVAELSRIPSAGFPSKESSGLRDLNSISRQDRKINIDLNGRAYKTSDAVQGTLTAQGLHYLHSHGYGDVFREAQQQARVQRMIRVTGIHGGQTFPVEAKLLEAI